MMNFDMKVHCGNPWVVKYNTQVILSEFIRGFCVGEDTGAIIVEGVGVIIVGGVGINFSLFAQGLLTLGRI